jgi:sister chromatid cohesion protein DCC1
MYLVSLSQPHNEASVLELSRSLEFGHEVRREVTLQVMRWFGQADDADERGRWKGGASSRLGYSAPVLYKVGFGRFSCSFPPPPSDHSSFDPNICFWPILYLQSGPISEDEFMTKRNPVVGDTFISNTSLKFLTVASPPLFRLWSTL